MRAVKESARPDGQVRIDEVKAILFANWKLDWRAGDGGYHNNFTSVCCKKGYMQVDGRGNWRLLPSGERFIASL